MAEKAEVRAEIDAELKERAESILSQLGISPSGAVEMLYSAIVRANGMPPELLQSLKPTAIGGMSGEELDAELRKGYESLQSGQLYTADEVDQMMKEEFGL
ncbi:MAG: type II toxin-antitoxin system RelB/DinJ family antitoxin [Prevotella sp.]|nr:type II toxin-antitoxin system RelB/DinJ family antitoxin [Prevotella sp.]